MLVKNNMTKGHGINITDDNEKNLRYQSSQSVKRKAPQLKWKMGKALLETDGNICEFDTEMIIILGIIVQLFYTTKRWNKLGKEK